MKVYKYRILPPVEGAEIVEQQIRNAHQYANLLTEIERARRALIPPRCPCAVESPKLRCTCDWCVNIAHCGSEDAAWGFVRGLAMLAADRAAHDHALRARADCNVHWGTYLTIEAANSAQRRDAGVPHFRRWDGSGAVAVQIQSTKPLTGAGVESNTDARLRLDRAARWSRTDKNRPMPLVRLRVGSIGRAPVWAAWPIVYHRPLPPGGRVTWAKAIKRRVGQRSGYGGPSDFRWELHVTVDVPTLDPKATPDRAGTVAVDLGYRVRPDGTRVGYWGDDAGNHGELVVPEAMRDELKRVAEVRSTRDTVRNDFRDRLVAWAVENVAILPDWFTREGATLQQWESGDRLLKFVQRWADRRFDGDIMFFDTRETCARKAYRAGHLLLHCHEHAACWAYRDRHLAQSANNSHERVIRQRNELYRVWSAAFARSYKQVIAEKFNLPAVAGRRLLSQDATDAEKVKADRASSVRHAAAPGTFRLLLQRACAARGTEFIEKRAAWTTIDCWRCGHRERWDAAPTIDHRCSSCGATWDQDYNATVNLRASGEVVSKPPSAKTSRFAGARRQKGPRTKRPSANPSQDVL